METFLNNWKAFEQLFVVSFRMKVMKMVFYMRANYNYLLQAGNDKILSNKTNVNSIIFKAKIMSFFFFFLLNIACKILYKNNRNFKFNNTKNNNNNIIL